MTAHNLMHCTVLPADAAGRTDLSTMSGWKFWFSDDLSLTGDCSLFDVADYDIVGEYKPPVCEDLAPSRLNSVSAPRGESTLSVESAPLSAVFSPSGASHSDSLGLQTKKTVSRVVHTCSVCARVFTSEKYLSMHVALHRTSTPPPPPRPDPCPPLPALANDSGTSIFKKTPVVKPRSVSAVCPVGRAKWTCEVCFKSFAQNSNYKNHIRTHSDERPFVCHVCSIGFKERYHLKKHTLFKHTGELNEECRQCGKRFKDSTAVRAHERIHSELRPYTCERCGKAFKTSECLWHHDHRSKTCGSTLKHMAVTNMADTTPSTTNNSFEDQTSSAIPVSSVTPPSTLDFMKQQQEVIRSTILHQVQPQVAASITTSSPSGSGDTTSSSLSFIPPVQIWIKPETSSTLAAVLPVKSENLPGHVTPSRYLHQFIATNGYLNTDIQLDGSPYAIVDSKLPLISQPVTVHHPFQRDATTGLFVWAPHHVTHKPVAVVVGQHNASSSGVAMATRTNNNSAKQKAICSRCGKQFASPLAFERHLAVHNETRPYRCELCDVGFKLKVHLKKHNLYRHNTDYPCQCRVCGKPFKDSSAVKLHERIHSTARPFQCACGKSFKTRENLWGHRHRRPCATRFGVDSVVSMGNATCRSIASATLLPAGNGGSSQSGNVSVNKSHSFETCYGDSHSGNDVEGQLGTVYDVTGATVSCEDVPKKTGVEFNERSLAPSASDVTTPRDVYYLDRKPTSEIIDHVGRVDAFSSKCTPLVEDPALHVNEYSSLPPFESLVPSFHHHNIPGSGVGGPACPLTSLNDVIARPTIPPPPNAVKLPCIGQLLDRTMWNPRTSATSSVRDVIECMTSDDNAYWDVDTWLDHKKVVTNRM